MRMTIPPALINCSYANAAGITAITPNQRQDGDPAFDRGTRIAYHFDADSSASAADGVLVPDAGDGRWLSDVAPSADAGGFTTATTHEAQIQEMYQHLFSAVGGYIPIPLSAWREVDATGDVGNITTNGGVLASDTTPVFDAVATSNEQEILWATGNADPIGCSVVLPRDFDDTADAYLDLEVSSGTTDAATIVCASAWSAGAAGTEVSDSTSDVATKSATPHRLTVTFAADDIPTGARRVTIRLTPPTHATNAIALHATGIAYKRKLLTA